MDLRAIADQIGIGEYPSQLDDTYIALGKDNTPACDLDFLDMLQGAYDTFGQYYPQVRSLAAAVNADPNRSAWIKTCVCYAKGRTRAEMNRIPVPKADGTPITAMLPLYILTGLLPDTLEAYRNRGFSEVEIGRVMRRFWDALDIRRLQSGMPGINIVYYTWLTLYVTVGIFELEVLQFEPCKVPDNAVYVKNILTGQIVPFLNKGMVHKSGLHMLGSVGFTDEEGAFEATFREDNDNIYGYGCFDGKVDTQFRAYPKSQWQVYLRPGDDFISFHIPRGADISLETLKSQFDKARQVIKERYPEYNCRDIFGSSWILDPSLDEIVKPESKIAQLKAQFVVYPVKSDGNSIFSFVFDGKPKDLHDLPEDSSLRRGVKKMYLEGRYNHIYAGISLL